MSEAEGNNGEIIIYQGDDGEIKIDVRMGGDTVWLTQKSIAHLFGVETPAISKHIKNIYESGELDATATISKMETVQIEGKREVTRHPDFYNLDVIIAVGYRVNSYQATKFRIWATKVLKEYLIKGFAMDDDRLKKLGGGGYWRELLDRIRDIRSSEKLLYRQVLDLYATSVDYDPKADESIRFFKIVQNKLHYAAHGHTAAEIVYERVDADKPFMGLTNFSGEMPTREEILIAKNYLNEKELKILNNLVSGYFDFAEVQAMNHSPMYMADYIKLLDSILSSTGSRLLQNSGRISHKQAQDKAITEYRKFQVKTISPVEQAYLDSVKLLAAKTSKRKK